MLTACPNKLNFKGYSSACTYINDLRNAPQISLDEHVQSRIENHPKSHVSDDGSVTVLPFAVVRGDVAPLGKDIASSHANQSVL